MDVIKNLLLYMTLTLALNLEAAPVPGDPPAPTASIVVSAVEEEVPTDASGVRVVGSYMATPGPQTPTPLPTLTPNESYASLSMGSRGEDVRRLQTRLKELGYLSGSIDGAFGGQTRNAVLLFQELNYLQKDGIAGKSTLTRLYEDPNVIPNPAVITPSPVPTATPDAEGLIPIPENPTENWVRDEKAQVMINGAMQLVPETGKAPRVWMRGASVVVSLSDLFSALEMDVTASWGNTISFAYAGYQVEAVLSEAAREGRSEDDLSFAQMYQVTVDGASVRTEQGDLMYEGGEWYATTDFFGRTMHASSRWEEEEKTLMMTIQDKSVYLSVD